MTTLAQTKAAASATGRRRPYVPVVGPRLRRLLVAVFGLFALLAVNSVYLVTVTLVQWATGVTYENYFYQWMFLGHLALGLLIIVPVVGFGALHLRNAWSRPNRRAVRAGLALFTTALVVLVTGVLLTRAIVDLRLPPMRTALYWLHVISPVAAVWLFVLHRLAGKRIRWKVGLSWAAVAAVFAAAMTALHSQDPRRWNVSGPDSGEQYFFPSLALTATGNFIPARTMLNDQYCRTCHPDIHDQWMHSVHRFSSFNNTAYDFAVRETRRVLFERDGHVRGSRFCAGCHDPVPFFSGEFEDPRFDDPNYDLARDPMATAGITCTVCHAITSIDSPRGNSDFTIEEPIHYPFAFSTNPMLRWVNEQLVKARPAFHKKVFLKPLHTSAEFCGSCHKVHLPKELNAYKWLRGQNHYDAFLLSGVSGHGLGSFYYPPTAQANCNGCHMPLQASNDFGAKTFEKNPANPLFGDLAVHGHQFPSANTAIPHLAGMPESVIEAHRAFNEGVMRLDVFALREGGAIDGALHAPLRPEVPALRPGERYLLETVIRTVKMGHIFTQGTADSNEVWLDVTLRSGDRVIGRSGGMGPDGEIDPWSHFVNAFVLDRQGQRIDRRNAQDIFVALYDHQIPPGAADVVQFAFQVPPDATEPITADVALRYRKFDATYMRLFQGEKFAGNDLPIMTLAHDTVTFPLVGGSQPANAESAVPVWERWNDFGIGLLRKGEGSPGKGQLRQAEEAFATVESLGRPDGPLNRARVYLREGRLDEAVAALKLAASFEPPAPPWLVAWFTGLVNKQNTYFDEAIAAFKSILEPTEETQRRGFDFSRDYRLLDELGLTVFERAKQEPHGAQRDELLREAASWFEKALAEDPENVTAHYGLSQVRGQLGDTDKAQWHLAQHARYKPDDNARERAAAWARLHYPAANHAAESVVIYDLQREGAYELPGPMKVAER